jgi:hypothetical protein
MKKYAASAAVAVFLLLLLGSFVSWPNPEYEHVKGEVNVAVAKSEDAKPLIEVAKVDNRPVITHVPLPKPAKIIYMTSCVAGTPSFRDKLVAFINETEINGVIIEIILALSLFHLTTKPGNQPGSRLAVVQLT